MNSKNTLEKHRTEYKIAKTTLNKQYELGWVGTDNNITKKYRMHNTNRLQQDDFENQFLFLTVCPFERPPFM